MIKVYWFGSGEFYLIKQALLIVDILPSLKREVFSVNYLGSSPVASTL